MVQGPMSHLFTIMMPWINAFKGNWVSSPLFSASPPLKKWSFMIESKKGELFIEGLGGESLPFYSLIKKKAKVNMPIIYD